VKENWRRTGAAAARKKKWKWLGHTVRRSDDSVDKPQDHRGRGRPRRRDLEKEMLMAGFRYSWRKMEVTAQDRAG